MKQRLRGRNRRRRVDRDENRNATEGRGYAAASLPINCLFSAQPAFRLQLWWEPAGHTLPASASSGALQIAPRLLKPPPPGSQASLQEEQAEARTLPTRPEINISGKRNLSLSVFTAKGQAGWWGRGQPEAPVQPWGHSIWPSIGLGLLSALETVPTSSEPPFQVLEGTTWGLGCPLGLAQAQLCLPG